MLSIPDEFAAAGTPLVLRKVDDSGVTGVRVCDADGAPPDRPRRRPGDRPPALDTWMTHAACALALSGTDAAAVARVLHQELP